MARIIENEKGRRIVKMSVDDIISVVREYQRVVQNPKTYEGIRMILNQACMYFSMDQQVGFYSTEYTPNSVCENLETTGGAPRFNDLGAFCN